MDNKDKRVILYYDCNLITSLFSIKPFLTVKTEYKFRTLTSLNKVIKAHWSNKIIVFRKFDEMTEQEIIETVSLLRKKYKTIAYFDDRATPIIKNKIIKHVDFYLKKQLFKDMNLYLKQSDIAKEYYGYPALHEPVEKNQFSKILLSWNLGVGTYPTGNLISKLLWRLMCMNHLPIFIKRNLFRFHKSQYSNVTKKPLIQASFVPRPKQRILIQSLLKNVSNANTNLLSKKHYDRELKKSRITISPFGHGEVTFRDFEAIYAASLLMKPSMEHIITYPNVYKPMKTYVPFDWDLSNLNELIKHYTTEINKVDEIVSQAKINLINELKSLDIKVNNILNEIF